MEYCDTVTVTMCDNEAAKALGWFVGWRGDIETGVGPNIRNKTMMHALNTIVSLLS
jgi:hypothetical protein